MRIRSEIRLRLRSLLLVSPVWLVLITGHSCVDKFPLPEEFDAAFVTGEICMPSAIATGTTEVEDGPRYPVRIETCVYRCIQVDRNTVRWNYQWRCSGGQCQMVLLITGHVTKVDGEKDCDARDLPDPPEGECRKEVFEYNITTPCCRGDNKDEYATGPFLVTIPYLTYDESQELFDRVEKGERITEVAAEIVGNQNIPERQFVVSFDPSYPPVESVDDLTDADCHHIPAP